MSVENTSENPAIKSVGSGSSGSLPALNRDIWDLCLRWLQRAHMSKQLAEENEAGGNTDLADKRRKVASIYETCAEELKRQMGLTNPRQPEEN